MLVADAADAALTWEVLVEMVWDALLLFELVQFGALCSGVMYA